MKRRGGWKVEERGKGGTKKIEEWDTRKSVEGVMFFIYLAKILDEKMKL